MYMNYRNIVDRNKDFFSATASMAFKLIRSRLRTGVHKNAHLLQWPERLLLSRPEMTWPCTYSSPTPLCWSLPAHFAPLAFLRPWSALQSPSSTWHMALVSPPPHRWGWHSHLASPPDWWAESRIAVGLSALWGDEEKSQNRVSKVKWKFWFCLYVLLKITLES